MTDDPTRATAATEQRAVTPPFVFFTCLHRADCVISFQCTGSSHRGGVLTRCSCECHKPEREVRNAD